MPHAACPDENGTLMTGAHLPVLQVLRFKDRMHTNFEDLSHRGSFMTDPDAHRGAAGAALHGLDAHQFRGPAALGRSHHATPRHSVPAGGCGPGVHYRSVQPGGVGGDGVSGEARWMGGRVTEVAL